MKCFAPASMPVLSKLATDFGVFDHWFCSVPSQTWCNRAFWHASTSWGWVNNPPAFDDSDPWNLDHWAVSSAGKTLFDLLQPGDWHVYEDLVIPLTKLVHWGDLHDKIGETYFRYLEGFHPFHRTFFDDCQEGNLPKYSFLEPNFINVFEGVPWHDDMHPSSFNSIIYADGGPGSVYLGDQLVWKVYQAIRNSPQRDKTLFIITFDEHGGCYDHVPPPQPVMPPDSKAFNNGPWNQCKPGQGESCFDFTRLGVRVPTVMVSRFIETNTIVNSAMDHCSFLKTMAEKWSLPSLGPRQDAAPPFTEVFATSPRTDPWPDFPSYPGVSPKAEALAPPTPALTAIPLNGLQGSILAATVKLVLKDDLMLKSMGLATAQDAKAILERVQAMAVPAR
jgi:phospholipase C